MGLTSSSSGRGAALHGSRRLKIEKKLPVIALAGNPNVGKSTVFNALTGLKQHTGNWSGKTVSLASGRMKKLEAELVDLPGCRMLDPTSEEEAIARDFILSGEADAVIVVVDATSLERSLALALSVLAAAERVIVCLNLIDEAKKLGMNVDSALLSKRLGAPVIPCAARSGIGLNELTAAADEILKSQKNGKRSEYRPFIGDDKSDTPADTAACFSECTRLLDGVIKKEALKKSGNLTERLDRILVGKYTALPIMFLLLLFIFYLTIIGANYPSNLLSALFSRLEALLLALFNAARVAPWLRDALILGAFRTVSWVVAVMLPPMAIFFPLFTLLEDLGYLPRAAFCLDRCFHACGSCGKQALTISMGFGCNAAGVVGCRIIPNKGEKTAAILTNSLVPCNGRFPMLITLCSLFLSGSAAASVAPVRSAAVLALLIVLSLGVTLAATKLLSKTLFRGEESPFLMELPPYRPPKLIPVLVRSMLDRTLHVLFRAIAVAAPAGLILYAAANIQVGSGSLVSSVSSALDPFARFFGLDGAILTAFILGFPANEIVLPIMLMVYTGGGVLEEAASGAELMSILSANGWTLLTAASTILFTLFHWPCSTTCLTIKKEAGGTKWMLLAILLPTAVGLILMAALNLTVRLFA